MVYMPVKLAHSRINEYMHAHYPPATYSHLLKSSCVSCETDIPQDIEHYETYGNYCPECCRMAESNTKRIKTDQDLTQFRLSVMRQLQRGVV